MSRIVLNQKNDNRFTLHYLISLSLYSFRQYKPETGTMPHPFGLDPDSATIYLHDPFDQGQTQTGSLAPGIQLVKKVENIFMIPGINSDAVIPHKKYRAVILHRTTDLDMQRRLISTVLYGVLHQVQPDFHQTRSVAEQDNRRIDDLDRYPPFADPAGIQPDRLIGHIDECNRLRRIPGSSDTRQFKQFVEKLRHLVGSVVHKAQILLDTGIIRELDVIFKIPQKGLYGHQRTLKVV